MIRKVVTFSRRKQSILRELMIESKKEVIVLFLNERAIPIKMHQLQALIKRLRKDHPKRPMIEQDLKRVSAGLWGEREVDRHLKRLDQEKYYIICGLRIPNGDGTYFQIDCLVLSSRFILIIEAKNITGAIYFDLNNHQFYRVTEDGKRESLQDPVSQARLHLKQLRQWLLRHKYTTILIDFLVASTNPHSTINILQPTHPYAKKITAVAGVTWRIDNLEEQYKKELITDKELRKLCKALLKAHTPLQPSHILPKYGISLSDVLTGVCCPEDGFFPLIYQNGKWYCVKCQKSFRDDVLLLAVNDYFFVVSPTMTNAEFRRFVHIDNSDTANHKLRKLNLLTSGKTKNRIYQLDLFN